MLRTILRVGLAVALFLITAAPRYIGG